MTHSISNNIRYTFFRGYCFPEQRTSNKSYDVRVCLHNYAGSILEGACRCVVGWVLWVSFQGCCQIFIVRQKDR